MSDKIFAQMTVTRQTLKAGTKTVYVTNKQETKDITEKEYKNIIDAAPFFRRLGGSETLTKNYTCKGYIVTKAISKSPCKNEKVTREFNFEV